MLFGSGTFLKFMAVALVAFAVAPARHRWAVLLALSMFYYASFRAPGLLAVLALVALTAWLAALRIGRSDDGRIQTRWMRAGVLGILFVLIAVRAVASRNSASAALRLGSTIGVSYFALQAISYVVDAYLGRVTPERRLGRIALALAFFPKIAQGPIERGRKILPQLDALAVPAYPALRSAALLFGWGMFKKAVLADRLAAMVDPVYADPAAYGGVAPVLATYAYAFQLYFDFSGYTDMARGVAAFFGVELSENFSAPYLATSIQEFWRRWHITFSRWLLDYIFTPLQLRLRSLRTHGTALALFVTFGVSGIWHGATACFAIWGLLHGTFLATSVLAARQKAATAATPLRRVGQIALTFHMVSLAWVFFRAPTVPDAVAVLASIARPAGGATRLLGDVGARAAAVTLLACVAYAAIVSAKGRPWWSRAANQPVLRWSAYVALGASILILGESSTRYLYFQF